MVPGFQRRDIGQAQIADGRSCITGRSPKSSALCMRFCGSSHLDLKRVAGVRVAPVVRLGEARGRGRGHDGARHVRHGQSELTGALAVDVDVERGIVRGLAQTADRAGRAAAAICDLDLLGEGVVVLQIAALHGHFDGRGRAEAHHLTDDVAGFERDLQCPAVPWRRLARRLLAQASPRGAPGFSANWMMASCGPLVNRWIRLTG